MSIKLKDCCLFQEGYVNPSQKEKSYFGGKIKWLRTMDLNNAHIFDTSQHLTEKGYLSAGKSAFMFPKNSIAISKSGTIGELAILDDSMCGNRAVIDIMVNSDKADLMYVFYTLKYKKKEIISKAVGSIQKNLYVSALETITLNEDNLQKQKKIAGILCGIDNKISNNNKIISELELMAKTIYDYWFFQYEFPNEYGKPYKLSGGKIVWNEELKKQIPEGWECKKIVEIEDNIVTGKTPSTKDEENFNGDIPFITIDDIRQGLYVSNTVRTLSEKGANLQIKKYIPKDSICVTCIATVGLVGITTKDSQTNQQINSIVCKNKNNLYYLVNAIKDYFEYSSGAKSGNIFDNMNKEDFASIKLIYPTEDVLEKFNEKVEPIYSKIKSCILENEELTKLRDYLLPLLMNGQVGFKN